MLADKKRWRELLSVGFFSAAVGSTTDNLMHHYHMWVYDNQETSLLADLTDDWIVYVVVTYLFIQWLPKNKKFIRMFFYWFIWTAVALAIEYVHIRTGHMKYSSHWSIWYSYGSDWVLYYLFYKYHQVLRLEKLSSPIN